MGNKRRYRTYRFHRGVNTMMFNTLPLPSLFRNDNECISCNKPVSNIEFYDYKCRSCISDRTYNMGNSYNKTHPQKEYML